MYRMELREISMYQACLLHSKAERVLKTLVSGVLEEWDITRMEWLLLATVNSPAKKPDGHTMGEIADLLDIRLSQLTALASRLQASALLSQTVSPQDRRTKYLNITNIFYL